MTLAGSPRRGEGPGTALPPSASRGGLARARQRSDAFHWFLIIYIFAINRTFPALGSRAGSRTGSEMRGGDVGPGCGFGSLAARPQDEALRPGAPCPGGAPHALQVQSYAARRGVGPRPCAACRLAPLSGEKAAPDLAALVLSSLCGARAN